MDQIYIFHGSLFLLGKARHIYITSFVLCDAFSRTFAHGCTV